MKITALRSALLASLALAFAQSAHATLLVGFNDFAASTASQSTSDATPVGPAAIGFSGLVTKGGQASVATGGSNDRFYGDSTYGVGINDGYARILGSTLTFSLTNNSGAAVQLDKLFFDSAIQSGAGTVTVRYQIDGGALSAPTTVNNTIVAGGAGTSANYGDYAMNLLSLSLANLSTISFVFTASPNARIDNVAISAIPEPGSLIALGCVLGSGFLIRRRNRLA